MKGQRTGPQKGEKILKVAARILSTKGYDKTSLQDIANSTKMTKAGLYYYFKSKEDLLYRILDRYMDGLLSGIQEIIQAVSEPLECLKECIKFQVNIYKNDPYTSKLILHDENCLTGTYFNKIKEKQREYLNYWKDALIRCCKARGIELDYPSVYAHLLVGICNWIYQWYNVKGAVKPDELAEKIFNLYFYGLLAMEKEKPDLTTSIEQRAR